MHIKTRSEKFPSERVFCMSSFCKINIASDTSHSLASYLIPFNYSLYNENLLIIIDIHTNLIYNKSVNTTI